MVAEVRIGDIEVEVVFKNIKNIHLSVYPPNGHVRISAPEKMNPDHVRAFAIDKIGWIRKQQKKLREQERETIREYLDGESHYVWGKRFLLEVVEQPGCSHRMIREHNKLRMYVRPGTTKDNREIVMGHWYRDKMKEAIPKLVAKWEPRIGKSVAEWGIKKMKTKWGSCNIQQRRIWLNLELAKKPAEYLEYILVHEMVHLLERHHNERFRAHMDSFLPQWENFRDMLNTSPLGHEDWLY